MTHMTRTPLSRSKGQRSTCCWCLKWPTCQNSCHLPNKYEDIVNLQGRKHIYCVATRTACWRCHWPAAQASPCLHSSQKRILRIFIVIQINQNVYIKLNLLLNITFLSDYR